MYRLYPQVSSWMKFFNLNNFPLTYLFPIDDSSVRKSDPDSYTARLLKQKQPPQYKQYTIDDYRNLKKDITLGGLGPDPELVSEKVSFLLFHKYVLIIQIHLKGKTSEKLKTPHDNTWCYRKPRRYRFPPCKASNLIPT